MSVPLTRYLLWRMRIELIAASVLVVAITLLQFAPIRTAINPTPWRYTNTQWLQIAMSVCGVLLALRTCCDSAGVGAWVGSRGVTRSRQFATRFLVGVFVLCGLTLLIALCQVSGLRQSVQLALQSPWFPMIRMLEVRALPEILTRGWIAFAFTFLVLTAVNSSLSLYPNFRRVMAIAAGSFLAMHVAYPRSMTLMIVLAAVGIVSAVVAACLWNVQEHRSC